MFQKYISAKNIVFFIIAILFLVFGTKIKDVSLIDLEEQNEIELKYNAMLVIQEETQKRIERQDKLIKDLREEIEQKDDKIKLAQSKQIDIKANFEKQLKDKDNEIKELKKQIKDFEKQFNQTKTTRKKKGE